MAFCGGPTSALANAVTAKPTVRYGCISKAGGRTLQQKPVRCASCEITCSEGSKEICRRRLFGLSVATAMVGGQFARDTRAETLPAPVDPATSPYVQELLRRTEEKREERYKERLADYDRRNFKEYLEFANKGGDSEEEVAIRQWLKRNK